jgi:hypothetical protein
LNDLIFGRKQRRPPLGFGPDRAVRVQPMRLRILAARSLQRRLGASAGSSIIC